MSSPAERSLGVFSSPRHGAYWKQKLSPQRDFNLNTARAVTLAIVLATDTLIIQPFYFLRVRHSQYGLIILDF